MCDEINISVKQSEPNIKKGWCNSPKGMFQILYDSGYIDSSQVKIPRVMHYSLHGEKKDIDKIAGSIKRGVRSIQ